MRALATALLLLTAGAQSYPPPFPPTRHDRDAVTVWIEDGQPHAAFVPAGAVHTEEQLGVVASATIFEIT